ncbi:helix-turn-helix domain-containing protein [Flagellimonas flava]|uniref:AraC-type DNA-binding protein n=1 Tax=Flagellimonas flava TaxID=570519 RepID=A0A1M5Q4B7_9FLAO|nr:helix-turn-helix domain-containing protein [Allomuricauda flava]SHH08964.1 AraC-type DNA-binding protein [Allomuricauda flava]
MNTLTYSSYNPKNLIRYIESYNIYCISEDSEHMLIPNGRMQLLFQLGAAVDHSTSFTKGWEIRPNCFIAGPYTKGYRIKVSRDSTLLSVVFRPGKYKSFFKNSIDDFTDQLYEPEIVWKKTVNEVYDQLSHNNSNQEKCSLVENFLTSILRPDEPSPIESAVESIIQNRGIVNIANISSSSGLSYSQFRKRFKKEIGLSPKNFQKITRVNSLNEFKTIHRDISLTRLAYEFNYSDQSHFNKDFKSICGLTPKTYFK